MQSDVAGVELCGALKNIVGVAAGISDGLGFKDNTKAAIVRIGLMEMKRFAKAFFSPVCHTTYLESCGVADLITTCYAGRHRRIGEAFVQTKGSKTFEQLEVSTACILFEYDNACSCAFVSLFLNHTFVGYVYESQKEMLNGQKLQGTITALEVS